MAYTVRASREDEVIIKKVGDSMNRKEATKIMLNAVHEYLPMKRRISELENMNRNSQEKLNNYSKAVDEYLRAFENLNHIRKMNST